MVQAVRIWDGRPVFLLHLYSLSVLKSLPCPNLSVRVWVLLSFLHPFETRFTFAYLAGFGECLERQHGLRQC